MPVATLLDFSASINPLGPSPRALAAIAGSRPALTHYPDPECWGLRRALSVRWKLSPEQFVVGNGSTELIHLLPRALAVRRALIIGPTFSEYAKAVSGAGGRARLLLAKRSDHYRPPLEMARQRLRERRRGREGIDAVFLCHPNSPTGQAHDAGEVLRLVREAERSGVWVVLDETFVEYCEERSLLPRLAGASRLIVLRSFTKFYALPGLRIGYLAASARVARLVSDRQPPWSVNALALACAEASLADRGHARRSLAYMERERARLVTRLRRMGKVRVYPSRANFLLIELPPTHRAAALAGALRRRGILVRDCSAVPGLSRRMVRVAVMTRRANELLVEALGGLLR